MSVPATAASAPAPERAIVHYPLFDYLRILLAAGVFLRHGLGDAYLSEHFGNACVQVFFALSGFLIGTILIHTKISSLPSFYFKRVVRIWIPYALAVSFLMTGTLLFQDLHDPLLWRAAFYNVTFVTNVFTLPQSLLYRAPMWGSAPHFWSICVEEQFYLVAPLVIVLAPRVRIPIIIAAVGLNLVAPHNFAAVSLGVLLAIVTNARPITTGTRCFAVLLFVAAVAATFGGWVSYSTAAPFGAVALVTALALPGNPSALGSFLGGMSYPFYLNHWIPLWMRPRIMRAFGVGNDGSVWIALGIATAFAAVHYVLVDRPVLERRSRWYSPARGRVAWAFGFGLVSLGLVVGVLFQIGPKGN